MGKEVISGIRSENMDEPSMTTMDAKMNGIVDVVELMGAESYIHVKHGEETIVVRINRTTDKKMGMKSRCISILIRRTSSIWK